MPASRGARLDNAARVLRTPLGVAGNSMVWHVWGGRGSSAVPLVLLHGGSGSWTHWLRVIEPLLEQGRALWVPDLPGFGDSDAPAEVRDANDVAAPLAQGLRELLGNGPCDLVGFSFGALTAGLLLAARPGVARRLVLVGAPAVGVPAARLDLRGWRHLATPQARQQVHRHNLATLMLHDPAAIDDETLALHAHNVERDRMRRRRLSQTDALARALTKVHCPVDVIYGEHDALYAGRMALLEAAFRATGCDLRGFALVAGAGHWVQHERTHAFLELLCAALSAP